MKKWQRKTAKKFYTEEIKNSTARSMKAVRYRSGHAWYWTKLCYSKYLTGPDYIGVI